MFEQRLEIAGGLIASMYIGNVALLIIDLPLVGLAEFTAAIVLLVFPSALVCSKVAW